MHFLTESGWKYLKFIFKHQFLYSDWFANKFYFFFTKRNFYLYQKKIVKSAVIYFASMLINHHINYVESKTKFFTPKTNLHANVIAVNKILFTKNRNHNKVNQNIKYKWVQQDLWKFQNCCCCWNNTFIKLPSRIFTEKKKHQFIFSYYLCLTSYERIHNDNNDSCMMLGAYYLLL